MMVQFNLLVKRRRESPKLSTSYKIMVRYTHMRNCFLCEMNFAVFSAQFSGVQTGLRLYPVNVIGASPSQLNETLLLVFRF